MRKRPRESWATGKIRDRKPKSEKPAPEPTEIVVEYAPIRCPFCGGRAKQYGDVGVLRRHRCLSDECGLKFKSVESPVRVLVCPSPLRHLLRVQPRR